MSEIQVTITVKRAARGEGDEPLTLIAASGTNKMSGYDGPACKEALDEATRVLRAAMDEKFGESWRDE